MWENRLGELRADTDIFTTFEGANNVLLQLVAKGLLTELREQFEELGVWLAVRHVTARAGTAVTELNPVITRKTDEEHLRDPEFHLAALRYREGRLLRSVAARMRSMLGSGRDGFDVVNDVQDHMMKLATAYTERLALESLQARADKAARTSLGEALRRLAEIYALSVIADDRGWFLESGYLETAKSKAIRTLLARLCMELHEHAPTLVDGWGIPERYLAPIAR
jgi:acyl-CoA oxidase